MKANIKLYQQTGLKAVEYQLQYQQPDGGYIWEGYSPDAFHKQAYSWGAGGAIEPAHKLLNWVKDNKLQPDGQLEGYGGDVYKMSWFFQGAHRLGRFDLTYPVMSFLLSCQAPCGGLPFFEGDKYCRSLSTCWVGVSALYFGRLDVAQRAAHWAISMLHQQPEEGRFYYQTTRDGRLVTADMDPAAEFIDVTKLKQCYWEVGLPLQLMCRLYMATGITTYLDYGKQFFEFNLSCFDDRFSYVGSGKSSLGAALYYLCTGDERAHDRACEFCEFLVSTQYPEGGWRDETEPDTLLIYIDHAAEFNVWLQEVSAALAAGETRWG